MPCRRLAARPFRILHRIPDVARYAGATVFAVVSGLWLGEHFASSAGLVVACAVALILGVTAATPFRRGEAARSVLAGLAVLVAFSIPWDAGAHEGGLAFNECVARGERLRKDLAYHLKESGRYPASLREMGPDIPGELMLPPGLITYRTNGSGYTLRFSDWLVTLEATESEPFTRRNWSRPERSGW